MPYVSEVIGNPYARDAEILRNFDLDILLLDFDDFFLNIQIINLLKSSISIKGNDKTFDIKFPIIILNVIVL